jgi:fatty-acyl-CoA synthase
LNLEDKDYVSEAKEYITLAENIGAFAVRVLGETDPEPTGKDNDELLIERLKALCQFAEPKGVTILLETNGVYASSNKILNIMGEVNSKNLGILWDIQHPIRNYNESIQHTWFKLKDYIKHIHLKDSTIENGKIKYKMLGKGDLPIKEVIALLKEVNYEHYVSLEWLKRWNSDLEDPGIVFGHYISTIKYMLK